MVAGDWGVSMAASTPRITSASSSHSTALAAAMRRRGGLHQFPLVMLTSLGERSHTDTATDEVRFAAYVTKPVKQSQLYNILTQVLRTEGAPLHQTVLAPRLDPAFAGQHPLRIELIELYRIRIDRFASPGQLPLHKAQAAVLIEAQGDIVGLLATDVARYAD